MEITWDPEKARSNAKKHGVRFPDVGAVFYDPVAISVQDLGSTDERRFVGIGADSLGRVVVVVYAYRGKDVRLISARKANKTECKVYEKRIRL